jgi:aldose 1-epimerase
VSEAHAAGGGPPRVFTIGDGAGMTLTVMDIGATWLSCRVPLGDGAQREVLLGHAAPADYLHEPGYLGAVVGRYANRIANARFALDGRVHELVPNEGPHHLHGGGDGFHRRRWAVAETSPHHVRLSLVSPAGDQGFPGELKAEVEYRARARTVSITFDAEVSEPCPVNLTSHPYFNLEGEPRDARGHRVRIAASRYLPIDRNLIPTGDLAPVEGTPFDLRSLRAIGAGLLQGEQQRLAGGYDHCFVLDAEATDAAELRSSDGRLVLTLATSYSGLQFYSGNHLAQAHGRDGRTFAPFAGVALEPQYFPDSPNRPQWPQPDCVLRPGERRRHFVRYRFAAAGL